jgi:hypothetical protein
VKPSLLPAFTQDVLSRSVHEEGEGQEGAI